jgi:hypothetical protein
MGTRICQGGCIYMQMDAQTRMTEATFVFMTPSDPDDFSMLMSRLASGIEVIIEVEDEDD